MGTNFVVCNNDNDISLNYFSFEPDQENWNPDNPCNSGGTLTYLDYDDSGNATMQSVYINPDSGAPHMADAFPPGIGNNLICEYNGLCLFDAFYALWHELR